MTKTNVTLSVDKQVVAVAKVTLAKKGKNMSEMVEKYLESMSGSGNIEKMFEVLKIQKRRMGSEEVERLRPKGADSERAVREMRNARNKKLSRY